MTFSSVFFLFAFLPVALILYFVMPKRLKSGILVLISLVFYAWGRPEYLVLMLFSIVFNYISGIELEAYLTQEQHKKAKAVIVAAVVVNLLALGFFKYYGFLVENINALLRTHIRYTELPLPIGISFYTFTAMSYIFDVYRGRTKAQKNILSFSLYMTFFPKVISGPIVQYADMEQQLANRTITQAKFGAGVNMFLVGLMKKVLIADNLGTAFTAIQGMSTMSAGTAWLGMIFYSLQLYFDFSGYSDMAIGLGKLFGFDMDKNFDYPYCSASVSEFWRRWHISLGAWFRQYVYIPLGGNRCGAKRQALNLLTVWLLTGIWHGASWNFVVWGLYHGAFVMLEKFVLKGRQEKLPKPVRVFGTVLVVCIGWVFFFSPSLGSALHYLGQMFGAGGMGVFDSTALYYLGGNAILLVLAILGSGPLVRRLHQRVFYRDGRCSTAVSVAGYVVLLLCCVAYLISATYTSFLYFQF